MEKIKEGIENILSMDETCLAEFGAAAKSYVNENKNERAAGKRIFALMNEEEK